MDGHQLRETTKVFSRTKWSFRARTALCALAAITCTSGLTSRETAPGIAATADSIRQHAIPIRGVSTDYDSLISLVGNARVVLLGEQTHGTHEFYRERARITMRLVREKGFTGVAIEGDWPDASRVNDYIRGRGSDATAEMSLSGFTRFPTWMWRNEDIRGLVDSLRAFNDAQPVERDVGFYGLDVYSMFPSIDAVLAYLQGRDAAAFTRASTAYGCFDAYRPDPQRYGAAAASGSCEQQALAIAQELEALPRPSDARAAEAQFGAARNARAVANAEEYFRTLYAGGVSTWNVRDRRMSEGLEAIEAHLAVATGQPPKIVVWAHNTHAGDARHTEQGGGGEINIGQLMRERHAGAAALVGFFTNSGTVYAASEWDQSGRAQEMRPALPESYSALFHAVGLESFYLTLRDSPLAGTLGAPRLERAIGVIYAPATERQSHYFTARLSQQFDAVIYFDRTQAVRPLPGAR